MQIDKTEQVGKVSVKQIKIERTDSPIYSDGSVEDELFQGFESDGDHETTIENIRFKSWAHEYHLSPVRHNLLKWYPFDPNGSILEVGAGCGALTGLLCNKLKKVVALEYSHRRALVTAQRHSEHSNLEVIIGGLQDFESEQKFNYITVIGVLEYAGTFYGGEDPYTSFLNKLRGLLTPDGELILAIENKIGLKYICGAPEDHTGRIFDSIYSYPYSSKVQTFSRKELTELFHAAGFHGLKWYYPMPDYKMPQEVLSEEIKPSDLDSIWNWLPARTVGMPRKEILSEKRLGKTLANAGLFGEFANSFLVVARRQQFKENFKCLRFVGTNPVRKPQYQTYIEICQKDQERIVIRKAQTSKARPFIDEIAKREILADSFLGEKAQAVKGRLEDSCLYYPYINYPSLQDLIADEIVSGDPGFGKFLIEDYRRFLYSLPARTCTPQEFMREFAIKSRMGPKPLNCLQIALLDCIPHNIKVSKEKWYVIDNEWTYDFPVPIDYLIFRGILSLVNDLQPQIQCAVSNDKPVAVFRGYGKTRQYIPFSWLEILQRMEIPSDELAYWEEQLQKYVWVANKNLTVRLREKVKVLTGLGQLRLRKNPKAFSRVAINETKTSPEILYAVRSVLQKVKNRLLRVL